MREVVLKPVYDYQKYHEHILQVLEFELYYTVFKPLFEIMGVDQRHGSKETKIIKLSELLPCPYNRDIDLIKVGEIKAMIKSTGKIKPFVVTEVSTDEGNKLMITDGHHRWLAVKELIGEGFLMPESKVPFVMADEDGIDSAKGISQVEIRSASRWNKAGSALERALKAGTVSYADGFFFGAFSAAIGKELRFMGARFDSRRKAYKLELGQIPVDLKTFIVQARAEMSGKVETLQKKINEIEQKSLTIDLGTYVKNVFGDLDKQFVRTVKPNLEIPMEMTAGMADNIETDYVKNVNLYINGWKQEQIVRLREAVQENAAAGFRADKMKAVLESEYGISKNRAKFIARQETALLVSKYREQRYTEAGINEYVWSTSHDERVRQDHKDLNGKKFSWDSPPVVDQATGRRGNPGEDFGCRCLAVPVLRIGG